MNSVRGLAAVAAVVCCTSGPLQAAIPVPADPGITMTLGAPAITEITTGGGPDRVVVREAKDARGIDSFGLAIVAGVGVMLLLSVTKAGGVVAAAAIACARRMR